MTRRGHPALFAVFALVLAPVGAAVLISALLLVGVSPWWVFAPGHGVRWLLASVGLHVPNAVGVLATVAVWWLALVAAGAAWERRASRTRSSASVARKE